jgi:hypothetical protein
LSKYGNGSKNAVEDGGAVKKGCGLKHDENKKKQVGNRKKQDVNRRKSGRGEVKSQVQKVSNSRN